MKISKLMILSLLLFSGNLFADKYVNGYYKSNGTYVQPHYRSNSNSTTSDNFSTYGNTNPYTGEKGTKKNDSYYGSGTSTYGSGSTDSKSYYGYGK